MELRPCRETGMRQYATVPIWLIVAQLAAIMIAFICYITNDAFFRPQSPIKTNIEADAATKSPPHEKTMAVHLLDGQPMNSLAVDSALTIHDENADVHYVYINGRRRLFRVIRLPKMGDDVVYMPVAEYQNSYEPISQQP